MKECRLTVITTLNHMLGVTWKVIYWLPWQCLAPPCNAHSKLLLEELQSDPYLSLVSRSPEKTNVVVKPNRTPS
jgi:hypothetical protein